MDIEHITARKIESGDVLRVNVAPTVEDEPEHVWRTVTQVRQGNEIVAVTIEGPEHERAKVVTHVLTPGCRVQVAR
ncbi:MAG: hypothetical protein EHM63_00315 [Actinobacteria bacterium]|nr:MAG: hypothetical protein EHM63_00315 [Actinomycetota bacterium]